MSFAEETPGIGKALHCTNCGAALQFAPGTRSLQCAYCGALNEIAPPEEDVIRSHDYAGFIEQYKAPQNTRTETVVKCPGCGATTSLPPNVTSGSCPFCATPLVVDMSSTQQILKPHYVLPFIIKQDAAGRNFQQWLKGLWFAPGDLMKKVADESSSALQGVYVPHWSYDTDTVTRFRGQRGEHYYVTETYTDGGQRKTRQVQHTRWHPANGTVNCTFRDILVSASTSLPQKTASILEPWDMAKLVSFDERFLSGFRSETYQTDAVQALIIAKQKMEPKIDETIRRTIGGDVQRIDSRESDYDNLALKYVMLPVWISSYKYSGKLYQFVVNACTGEVTGERPWSTAKIALAILLGLLILSGIYYLTQNR